MELRLLLLLTTLFTTLAPCAQTHHSLPAGVRSKRSLERIKASKATAISKQQELSLLSIKATYLADYDLYRAILGKAHAGLYKYHTKAHVDSVLGHYRQRIDGTKRGQFPLVLPV